MQFNDLFQQNDSGNDVGSFAVEEKVLEAWANGQGTLIKAKVAP